LSSEQTPSILSRSFVRTLRFMNDYGQCLWGDSYGSRVDPVGVDKPLRDAKFDYHVRGFIACANHATKSTLEQLLVFLRTDINFMVLRSLTKVRGGNKCHLILFCDWCDPDTSRMNVIWPNVQESFTLITNCCCRYYFAGGAVSANYQCFD
jgi:hypothetical protein